MKKYILILGLILSFNASADDLPSCGENCTYIIEGDTLTIKPIDSTTEAKIKSYTRYGSEGNNTNPEYAPWRFNNEIKKVVIESGITSIGYHSFEDIKITEVSLPEGLKTIEGEAFHNTSLVRVDLPSSLTRIGRFAFCIWSLQEVSDIPEGVTRLEGQVFSSTKIKNWVIPEGVKNIDPTTFGSKDYSSSSIENLYCNETIADQCDAAVQWKRDLGKTVKVTTYKKDGDKIFYKNKWYNNANDILSGDYIKKRIYTIDEANQVAGKVNSVKIRYR